MRWLKTSPVEGKVSITTLYHWITCNSVSEDGISHWKVHSLVKQYHKKVFSLIVLLRFLLKSIAAKFNTSHVMGIFLNKQGFIITCFSKLQWISQSLLLVHIQPYQRNEGGTLVIYHCNPIKLEVTDWKNIAQNYSILHFLYLNQ